MWTLSSLSLAIILFTSAYLIGLGLLSIGKPHLAARFLLGFAQTAKRHYLELMLRTLIGGALIYYSTAMLFATGVEYVGWGLVGTTFLMTLTPWRLHQRFAQKFVPYANRHLKLIGGASFLFGSCLLIAVRLFE